MLRIFLIACCFLVIARSAFSLPLENPVREEKHNEHGSTVTDKENKEDERGNVAGLEEQMRNERENRGVVGEAVVSRPGILAVLPFRGKVIMKVGEKIVVGLIKKVVKTAWGKEE